MAVKVNADATATAFTSITWGTAVSQPYTVTEAQGGVVNGKLYSFGGFDSQKSTFTPTSRAYSYDPVANKWTALAPMPPMNGTSYGGVTHAGFATDGADIYFAGGYTSNSAGTGQIFGTREVWKYMVSENRYERLPDLPIVIAAGQLEYLNGKLHHIGGTNAARTSDLGNHYVLQLDNLAAGWKSMAPLPAPRQHAGSAVYGDKIYYIGGQTGHDSNLATSKLVHRYDPLTDTWAQVADLPVPSGANGRGHISSSVVVVDDRILVLGGETVHGSGRTNMVSAYTPATNTWQNLTSLPQARYSGVAALLGKDIYYTGGSNSSITYKGVPAASGVQQQVSGFTLFNADSKNEIQALTNGAELNLATLPTKNLNIRANTSPSLVGSVVFAVSGTQSKNATESRAPYDLMGDDGAWTPVVGSYTLKATPYTSSGGGGTAGTALAISFSVVDKETDTTQPLISTIVASSGRSYALAELAVGAKFYTDRTYEVTSVPSSLAGSSLVRTANDDKKSTASALLSFELGQPATVYVAYDPRAAALPTWLSGWQKLTDRVGVNDSKISYMDLYSKSFAAGAVSLGGNLQSPAAGAETNYFVVAKAEQAPSAALVSNITASSGRSYALAELAVGAKIYTDRTYEVTSVPSLLTGSSLVRTANDDKRSTASALLSFELSQSATVYVAYDPRAGSLPTWLSGWQKLTDRVGVNDSKISYMDLYSKSFAAGAVSLGGNLQSPAAGAETNYFVVAKAGSTTPVNALAFSPATLSYTVVQGEAVGSQSTVLSANQGSPAVSLSKSNAAWLTLPASSLGTLTFGSANINSNLTPGTYEATVTATASDYQSSSLQINLTVKAPTTTTQDVKVNFQLAGSTTPSGYIKDSGLSFDAGRGYGWVDPATKQPKDLSANMRERTGSLEARLRTLCQMQAATNGQVPGTWEYVVPNGTYNVSVSAGDPSYFDSKHQINVEGKAAITNFVPSSQQIFQTATVAVDVSDGKLTVDAAGGTNTKINYIIISPATAGTDITPPVATIKFTGTEQSAGVYKNEVYVSVEASDEGGSGLASVQYSLNNGAYTAYTAPLKISNPGNYTIRARATDNSNNETVTNVHSFSVVTATSSNAYMVVENRDKFPASDQLTFSLIQIPWRRTNDDGSFTPYNENHNKVKLRINNKGTGALVVSNLVLSNTSAWKIEQLGGVAYDASTALPLSVASKSYVELVIEFIAVDQATRVKVLQDALYISSNDDLTPYKEVKLRGLWQKEGEGRSEPYAQEIISAFGYKTRTGFSANDGASDGNYIMPNSDEIMSAFFLRVDPSKPVEVTQMAAYHGCCSSTETFKWYDKGSTTTKILFTHSSLDGQSLLPRKSGSTTTLARGTFTPAATTANPTAAFGFRISKSDSDRTKNFEGGIALRIWKAVDGSGNVIPNAYLIGMDYLGTEFTNFDYQDNIYYVSNVKPEEGPAHYAELGAAPSTAFSFGAVMTGASKSLTVDLKNLGGTYASGSDPDIQIQKVEVVGPNLAEFSTTAPGTTTLAAQAFTSVSVKFSPSSRGIKNAALLVYYNSASSPLRVPLYGIANDNSFTIGVVKRVKGAADANVTIGGNTWEADINYRKGSIKLDKQVVTTPIAATDDDVLYQTYLSAGADLSETRYEIPVANGSYMVRMHFVENFFSAAGARVFNITIENQPRLSSFDIYSEVGYRSALVKDFDVNVTDGVLNLKFNPTANRLAIAGVEIFKATAAGTLTSSHSADNATLLAEGTGSVLRVYPNPTSGGQVYAEVINFGRQEAVTITLHDVLGRVIASVDAVTDQQGHARAEVPGHRQLKRGMYIIRAKAASGKAQTKLLVQ